MSDILKPYILLVKIMNFKKWLKLSFFSPSSLPFSVNQRGKKTLHFPWVPPKQYGWLILEIHSVSPPIMCCSRSVKYKDSYFQLKQFITYPVEKDSLLKRKLNPYWHSKIALLSHYMESTHTHSPIEILPSSWAFLELYINWQT